MELCLQALTDTEKEEVCAELKIGTATFEAWNSAFLQQCKQNPNFERSFLEIMQISDTTPRDVKFQLFFKYNTTKKCKKMVSDLMAKKTSSSKEKKFKERMGFSRECHALLQMLFSEYERDAISIRNAELQAEIEILQDKIRENEQTLKEKWPVVYEYKGLAKRVRYENEDNWYKDWEEMSTDAKLAYTNYQKFKSERAGKLLIAARRDFMNREDVKSTMAKCSQQIAAERMSQTGHEEVELMSSDIERGQLN